MSPVDATLRGWNGHVQKNADKKRLKGCLPRTCCSKLVIKVTACCKINSFVCCLSLERCSEHIRPSSLKASFMSRTRTLHNKREATSPPIREDVHRLKAVAFGLIFSTFCILVSCLDRNFFLKIYFFKCFFPSTNCFVFFSFSVYQEFLVLSLSLSIWISYIFFPFLFCHLYFVFFVSNILHLFRALKRGYACANTLNTYLERNGKIAKSKQTLDNLLLFLKQQSILNTRQERKVRTDIMATRMDDNNSHASWEFTAKQLKMQYKNHYQSKQGVGEAKDMLERESS